MLILLFTFQIHFVLLEIKSNADHAVQVIDGQVELLQELSGSHLLISASLVIKHPSYIQIMIFKKASKRIQ